MEFRYIVASLILILLVGSVSAAPTNLSTKSKVEITPGETQEINFNFKNLAEDKKAFILNVGSISNSFTIASREDDQGVWKPSENKWLFTTVLPGESRTPSIKIKAGENARSSFSLNSEILTSNGIQDNSSIQIKLNLIEEKSSNKSDDENVNQESNTTDSTQNLGRPENTSNMINDQNKTDLDGNKSNLSNRASKINKSDEVQKIRNSTNTDKKINSSKEVRRDNKTHRNIVKNLKVSKNNKNKIKVEISAETTLSEIQLEIRGPENLSISEDKFAKLGEQRYTTLYEPDKTGNYTFELIEAQPQNGSEVYTAKKNSLYIDKPFTDESSENMEEESTDSNVSDRYTEAKENKSINQDSKDSNKTDTGILTAILDLIGI